MKEIAKWAWLILIGIIGLGFWFFVIIGVWLVVYLLVMWLKPEWLKYF